MSLKAKIEAVVYAAEEPVTLAQVSALFAEEALEWKRQQDAPPGEALDLAPMPEQAPLVASESAASEPTPSELVAAEAPAADPVSPAEAEEKRAARQRDREVREILRGLLGELIEEYAQGDRGIEIREIAGGYRIGTKPEYHDSVRGFVRSLKPPLKLSLQALETLAVIAYKQPVTAPEVSEIRGVDSAGVLGSLISRKLITTAGRKQVIGRPILYKTTKEFLLRFGLKDVNELPSIEEFEKMAGELADSELAEEPESPISGAGDLPFTEAAPAETNLDETQPEESNPAAADPATSQPEAVDPAAPPQPVAQTVPAEGD
ncbi:MAG: SMC-Scp complex subunit ScpB [Elusimicrobia bacterium]|nr:SMC-Scp complex subunit ScpB [Elusimicrobiota bacterium]